MSQFIDALLQVGDLLTENVFIALIISRALLGCFSSIDRIGAIQSGSCRKSNLATKKLGTKKGMQSIVLLEEHGSYGFQWK